MARGAVSALTPFTEQLRALSCTYDPDNRALCELLALSRTCCPEVVPLPEQWWAEQPAYLGGMRVLGFSHVLRVLDLRALCTALAYVLDGAANR